MVVVAHVALQVALPAFDRTGIEVELSLHFHFCGRVAGTEHFHTDLACLFKDLLAANLRVTLLRVPGHVHGFDSVGSGHGALR